MSQHDFNIANQTFPLTRADLNNALAALASLNSGSSAPSTTVAGLLWYDTSNGLVKVRDAANAAWVSLWAIPTTTNEVKLPGGTLRVESTAPVLGIKDTDADSNEKAWQFAASGTSLSLTTRTDADAAGDTILAAARTGTTVDGLQLGGTGVWGAIGYFAAAGSSNAFTGTLAPAPAAYQTGLMVQFYANHTITGASTLNLNSLGTKNLKDKSGNSLTSGQITNGDLVVAYYNGTEFRCVGIGSAGGMVLLNTFTASSSTTVDVTGLTGYKTYIIKAKDILMSAAGHNLVFQASTNNGSSWLTTNVYESSQAWGYASTWTQNEAAATSNCGINARTSGSTAGLTEIEAVLECVNFSSTTPDKQIFFKCAQQTDGGEHSHGSGSCRINTSSAVNAIRFTTSNTGLCNMTSGTFEVWGIN